MENSVAVVVQEVSDQLWTHPELVRGGRAGQRDPLHHLLSRGSEPVRRALSHPQALAQCAGWLARSIGHPAPFGYTAGAALGKIAELGFSGDGAIASRASAGALPTSDRGRGHCRSTKNQIRFLIVGRGPAQVPERGELAELASGPGRRAPPRWIGPSVGDIRRPLGQPDQARLAAHSRAAIQLPLRLGRRAHRKRSVSPSLCPRSPLPPPSYGSLVPIPGRRSALGHSLRGRHPSRQARVRLAQVRR